MPAWLYGAAAALFLWIFFVLSKFDQKFPVAPDAFFQLLDGFAIAQWASFFGALAHYFKSFALIVAVDLAALGWGCLIVPHNEPFESSLLERFLLCLGMGLGCLSMMMVVLGVTGHYDRTSLWCFYVLFCGAGLWWGRSLLKESGSALRAVRFSEILSSPLNWFLIVLAAAAVMMAFVPELFYDSLVYHLGLPQMYVNEGRLIDTPNVYFSRFPMFMHMLYVLAVGLDGSAMAKLFNTTVVFTGMGTLLALARRLEWARAGAWACLFILAMPVFQLNAWTTSVDVALGTYASLGFLAYMIWKKSISAPRRWFVVFSLCVAFVFGIKYTGVVMVLAYGALLVIDKRGASWFVLARRLCVYSFVVLMVMSPWLARNILWTGNPVYPILWKVFPSRGMNTDKIQGEENSTKNAAPHSLGTYVSYPWRQTMKEASNFNFIGPMTLAGLPLIFFLPWKKVREQSALFILIGLYFAIGLHFSGEIRYLLPGFFLLSLLMMGGIFSVTQKKRWVGWLLQACFALLVFYQMLWIFQCMQGLYKPGPVLTGQTSRLTYVSTMHDGLNLCPWNTMQQDLEKMPETTRIYILGGEQVFGFPKRFWYSSCHDDAPLVLWANASSSAEELYRKLAGMKMTHILINAPEAVRLGRSYGALAWTDQGRRVFVEFAQKYLQLVNVKPIDKFPEALFLYEIKENSFHDPVPFEKFYKDILNL